MHFNIIKYKKIYFTFTGILVVTGIFSLAAYGLKPGIDFTGGSMLEIIYGGGRPSNQEIRQKISDLNLGEVSIQPTGDNGVILRMPNIDEAVHQEVLSRLTGAEEISFESIGPTIGAELKNKTATVAILSLFAMVIYIVFAFGKVSYPVRSWQYGLIALMILAHDVFMPLGVFSLLGKFAGVQITIPVVVALLTVIGYAINNVVVVFDRIRENISKRMASSFTDTVSGAINQTLSRQINTSLTTLFPLLFIYFIGGETLKYFALALIVGIVVGLYSSIFLAGPILTSWAGSRVDKRVEK